MTVSEPGSNDHLQKITAYHEAGHAFMAFLKKVRIVKVSIIPDERAGTLGHLVASSKLIKKPGEPGFKESFRTRLENFCMVAMAGLSAEYILTGAKDLDAIGGDLECIDICLGNLTHSRREFNLYRDLLWIRTETFLREKKHWAMIEMLAHYLLTWESTIKGSKAKEIFRKANPRLIKKDMDSLLHILNKKRSI